MYQSRVDAVAAAELKGHKCLSLPVEDDDDDDFIKTTIRTIVVIDNGRNFVLKVPVYNCRRCRGVGASGIITVPPCAVNCGPTAPTEACLTWITDEALHLFDDLHARIGLAVGGKPIIKFVSSRFDIHVN
jgi:hypothetical protein